MGLPGPVEVFGMGSPKPARGWRGSRKGPDPDEGGRGRPCPDGG